MHRIYTMDRTVFFKYKYFGILSALILLAIGITQVVRSKTARSYTNKHVSVDKEHVIPVVIIGSGPAGLVAAVYTTRECVNTIVIEGYEPGGLLTQTERVDNWPGVIGMPGQEIIDNLKKQATYFGATFLEDVVEHVDFDQWPYTLITENGKTLYARTVIIATGASPCKLGIPGEDAYWGRGVSTCALCDAPFYQDATVVVVGGGDSAIEEATTLAAYAKQVRILVRKDHMRAAASMQERLGRYPNITVKYNTQVHTIDGDGNQITTITLHNNKVGDTWSELIDGLFLAIGHQPNTAIFRHAIKTDDYGYIELIGRSQATSKAGVFACGDVADHDYRQAGVAAGDGIKAAIEAVRFLQSIVTDQ